MHVRPRQITSAAGTQAGRGHGVTSQASSGKSNQQTTSNNEQRPFITLTTQSALLQRILCVNLALLRGLVGASEEDIVDQVAH